MHLRNRSMLAALAGIAIVALACSTASATVVAYEGFDVDRGNPGSALAGLGPTGTGFTGVWDTTNGSGTASSYETAGLAYPGSYPGTHVAIGGNGRATGQSGQNAFLALDFDATADAAVNSASEIHIGFLAQMVAQSVTDAGVLDAATRTQFNLAAEYPRNAGVRLMNIGNGNNSALGTIGNAGNWNGNNQSVYNVGDVNPEVVDTWAIFNFNDANNLFTGNGGAGPGEPDPSPNYNPAPAHFDGVDHIVLSIDTLTSSYRLQVNPQMDGSNDGEVSFVHTDGGVVPFVMKAFGVEAGNDSSDRPVGDMVFDEVYIGTTFESAAGFVQIPEPSSLTLLGILLGCAAAIRRR